MLKTDFGCLTESHSNVELACCAVVLSVSYQQFVLAVFFYHESLSSKKNTTMFPSSIRVHSQQTCLTEEFNELLTEPGYLLLKGNQHILYISFLFHEVCCEMMIIHRAEILNNTEIRQPVK